jgi:hypothetical protein
MFDVCTTGDVAQIDMIFKFLPHTRVNMGASIFFTAAMKYNGPFRLGPLYAFAK